jgi:hypothetical protein
VCPYTGGDDGISGTMLRVRTVIVPSLETNMTRW